MVISCESTFFVGLGMVKISVFELTLDACFYLTLDCVVDLRLQYTSLSLSFMVMTMSAAYFRVFELLECWSCLAPQGPITPIILGSFIGVCF